MELWFPREPSVRRAVSACFFKLFKFTISNLSHACLKRHSQYSDMRSSFRALVIRSRAGHEYGNRRVDEEQIGHSHNNTKKSKRKEPSSPPPPPPPPPILSPPPKAAKQKARRQHYGTHHSSSRRRTSRSLTSKQKSIVLQIDSYASQNRLPLYS